MVCLEQSVQTYIVWSCQVRVFGLVEVEDVILTCETRLKGPAKLWRWIDLEGAAGGCSVVIDMLTQSWWIIGQE